MIVLFIVSYFADLEDKRHALRGHAGKVKRSKVDTKTKLFLAIFYIT